MNTAVRAPTTVSTTGNHTGPGASMKAANIDSLLTNPRSGGMPAMDAAARASAPMVIGIRIRRFASSRMSRVPASWSMTPMSMNSAALNRAWATVWTTAAVRASGVPTPIMATRSPSWLIVE